MKLLRNRRERKAFLKADAEVPPEHRWRIDYARNELVNAATPPRRIPIQPGEPIMGAVLRHGIIPGASSDTIYRMLNEQ